jgi:signal transduction histidine kinase
MTNLPENEKLKQRIKHLENRVQELEKNLPPEYFENLMIGVIQTDLDTGNVIYANKIVLRILGYNGLDEMREHYSIPDSYVEPAGREKMLKLLKKQGSVKNYDLHIYDGKGIKKTLLYSAYLDKEKNIINGITIDITPRKEGETILKESEEKYRLLFDHMSSGFILCEMILDDYGKASDFRIFEINQTMKEYFNITNDIKNKSARELEPKIPENMIMQLANVGITGRSVTFERYVQHVDKHFRIHAYSPKPGQIAVILDDITPQKKVENELKKQKDKLEKQTGKLEELNITKDKLFTIISHDLRNPFNTILNLCTLLKQNLKDYKTDEIEKFINLLNESAGKGFYLLENLLNWSRSQTNQINIMPSRFDISFLIDLNIDLFRQNAMDKKVELISAIDHKMFVYADEDMVNTVIRNLISNALKYTHEKGKITIHAKETDDFIEVSVKDTGIGIEPEDLKNLFRIDVNKVKPGTGKEKGTGLGLIICKEFIEKNGGQIWAKSTQKKGSIFYFTIPRAEVI